MSQSTSGARVTPLLLAAVIDERTSADDVVRAFRSAQREEIQRGRTDHRSLDDARSALLGVLSARSEHALRSERDRESEARAGVDHVLPGG